MLFAPDFVVQHLLLVDALDIGVVETLECQDNLDCKSLLLGVELCRISLEYDAEGALAHKLDVFEVIHDKLRRLCIVLQGFHHVQVFHHFMYGSVSIYLQLNLN